MEQSTSDARNVHTPEGKKPHDLSASPSKTANASFSAITVAGSLPLTERQTAILEARGIDIELASRLGWRSAKQKGIGDSIDIPYFRNGKEVNCKTRTIDGEKRFYQVEGGEKCFYNVDALKDLSDAPLIITEGEMDCLIALQCGHIAVSVPDGAPAQEVGDKHSVKYDYLKDIPQSVKKIILAVDGDNAGTNLLHDLALRLGAHRCMWVKYPKGCKDLNDAYIAWKERGVNESLARAQYMQIDGIYKMEELPPMPWPEAFAVGIPALVENFRLRRGDLSIFTGVPSHGKTTVTNCIAYNMAKLYGWVTCFASFEQPPQTEHRRVLRTLFTGIPAWQQQEDRFVDADKFIDDNFVFIVPPEDSDEVINIAWLKARMAVAVTRYNARLIIIDPWNEVDHMFNANEMTMTQYVGMVLREFKHFARKFMVHVMIVAHPSKLRRDKSGHYPIPTAYDIADSSHFYNKPDQVVVIHRTEEKKTLFKVAKSRYHHALGKPGDVELTFDDYTYTFS